MNLDKLIEVCQKYTDFVDNDDEYHEDNDYSNFVFEAAMEAVFGEGYWDWHNARQE